MHVNFHVKETGLKLKSVLTPKPVVRTLPLRFPQACWWRYLLLMSHVCTLSNRKKRLAQLYQQTTCFSLLWQIYSLNYFFHYKYYCHLAALMQVNTALETQDDFQVGYFCSCFLRFWISFGEKSLVKANQNSKSWRFNKNLPD